MDTKCAICFADHATRDHAATQPFFAQAETAVRDMRYRALADRAKRKPRK